MRQIKFRGQTFDGKTVYGGYYCEEFSDTEAVHAIIDEGGKEFIVDPETHLKAIKDVMNKICYIDNTQVIHYETCGKNHGDLRIDVISEEIA